MLHGMFKTEKKYMNSMNMKYCTYHQNSKNVTRFLRNYVPLCPTFYGWQFNVNWRKNFAMTTKTEDKLNTQIQSQQAIWTLVCGDKCSEKTNFDSWMKHDGEVNEWNWRKHLWRSILNLWPANYAAHEPARYCSKRLPYKLSLATEQLRYIWF